MKKTEMLEALAIDRFNSISNFHMIIEGTTNPYEKYKFLNTNIRICGLGSIQELKPLQKQITELVKNIDLLTDDLRKNKN